VAAAPEHFKGVREEVQDGLQGFFYGFGAAGQIYNDGIAAYAGYAAGQGRFFCFFQAFGAHQLGQAWDSALYYRPGSFGGYVAAAEAGASGGDDQVYLQLVAIMEELFFYGGELVGNDIVNGCAAADGFYHFGDKFPAEVFGFPARAAVAGGEHGSFNIAHWDLLYGYFSAFYDFGEI